MNIPKVSIITPTFNGQRFIAQTIRSVLAQSFRNFEMIIVDDGSTDDTQKIVSAFSDRRIQYVRHHHRGCTAAYNACIELAKGQFIAVLDHDDLMAPERLSRQVKFMEKNPGVGLVGSSFIMIDESGFPLRKVQVLHGMENVRRLEAVYNAVYHPTILYSREVIERIGGYKEEFFPAHDTEFLLRAIDRFRADNITECLTLYRKVQSSPTRILGGKQQELHYSVRKQYNGTKLQKARNKASKRIYALNLGKIAYFYGSGREARYWFLQSYKIGMRGGELAFYFISSFIFYPVILLLRRIRARERAILFWSNIRRSLNHLLPKFR
ncbi:MAG: glycosyltransferase, partial [Ignavibacteriales bacterium]|nr:glycosyltransferase [Ignavibacteriales bacterium]